MPNENRQKVKLLILMELLRQETDEDHPITTSEIIRRIGEYGISCERRTVGKDIRVLREQGFEIMSELHGHENRYWIADRSFDLPELKILMDAVQAARFIPEEKTEALIAKIAALGGSHQAELLQGNLVQFNTRKHSNQEILYNIQAIEGALQQKTMLSFRYFDLDESLGRRYRMEGGRYVVEPVSLIYENNNYYLLAYHAKYDKLSPYRVDRMDQVRSEDTPVSETAAEKTAGTGELMEQAFRMFLGRTETVTFRFHERLIGVMFDRFGEGLEITRLDKDFCQCRVEVQISPPFWGWLLQYHGDLHIVEPEALNEEYRTVLRQALGEINEVSN